MLIDVCVEGTRLEAMVEKMCRDERVRAVMVLACDADCFTPEDVDPWLKECPCPIFGGIFPQIIDRGQNLQKGVLVAGLAHEVQCATVSGLSDPNSDLDRAVEKALSHLIFEKKTVFVFVDGLSTRIGALVEALFNHVGLIPHYIGGGAGSLTFEQKPCLFTNEGLVSDSVIFAVSHMPSGIGVAHGWHPISGTLKVTESVGNRVISLNWQPALKMYRETIDQHQEMSFDEQPFFEIAKAYPLGIVKLDTEMVVRDPIMTQNDELICVGEVPQGSFVYVLNGDAQSLIEGAVHARNTALSNYSGAEEEPVQLFIDCISRVLFMGNEFQKELEAVGKDRYTFGALTMGEIANTGDAYLEFYNKTAVVGILGDQLTA